MAERTRISVIPVAGSANVKGRWNLLPEQVMIAGRRGATSCEGVPSQRPSARMSGSPSHPYARGRQLDLERGECELLVVFCAWT